MLITAIICQEFEKTLERYSARRTPVANPGPGWHPTTGCPLPLVMTGLGQVSSVNRGSAARLIYRNVMILLYMHRLAHILHPSLFHAAIMRDPAEQRRCFHWSNLQPLWAFDNQSKGDRWTV